MVLAGFLCLIFTVGSAGSYFFLLELEVARASSVSQCVKPSLVKSEGYSTSDSFFNQKTVFAIDFTIQCENQNAQTIPLYWEMDGRFGLVSQLPGNMNYQFSWTTDHKKAHKGTYEIRIYDEQGYATIRKVISREQVNVSSGEPWISSPTAALLLSGVVLYYACQWRTKL
ncbi:translocon associated protein complex delta subun it; putative translocon associated protein subunit delta [Trichuris trichiura]|uniref:Translocon-associated protein subunit delta n=1 Tax=Trichuris trichiura TaxID=36087 RepID=A0A077ZCV6_TRITR|nr:translocon associated protein complex delta subun it; putative translocon associated protein subunit delta [Trichuris trichiura]